MPDKISIILFSLVLIISWISGKILARRRRKMVEESLKKRSLSEVNFN